jgi:heterodisulfide reductase subunit A
LKKIIATSQSIPRAEQREIDITKETAVIGDSIAALQVALDIADQDFPVHLLISGSEISETDRQIFWHVENIEEKIKHLAEQTSQHSKIQLYKQCEIKRVEGEAGNFKLIFNEGKENKSLTIGAVVIASGAELYKPSEFSYDKNSNVLTQNELDKLLAANNFSSQKVVMIQCVGSRQPGNQYCSQNCCEQAIKNALKIKQAQPEADIYVLHKDIRVSDFEEDNYTEAIEKGVTFIRIQQPPQVQTENGKFAVQFIDEATQKSEQLGADLVVLSSGIVPHSDNQAIATIVQAELTDEGFYRENGNLMNLFESSRRGIFIAGLSRCPQRLEDTSMQATALAGRIGVMFRNGRISMLK